MAEVRNPEKFTIEDVKQALEKSSGVVNRTAKLLGVSTVTVYNYLKKYPELRETREIYRSAVLGQAEENLLALLEEGNVPATLFTLRTIGREDFGDRTDIVLSSDKELIIKVVYE